MNENPNDSRRQFLKTASATAVLGGLGVTSASANTPAMIAQDDAKDLHICRGLNTKTDSFGKKPGECDASNLPAPDLHGCAGGNTCANLGACGTGDYATQYWVSENACGRSGTSWTGSGGCGVPIGASNTGFICSQLNNAVPTPSENPNNKPTVFVGVPVWAIARARFEQKMVGLKKPFGVPTIKNCGEYQANSYDGKTYKNKGNLPEPYPEPKPDKPKPS